MEIINKYVVLEKEGVKTLHGDGVSIVSFNESYVILFQGSLSELEESEYSNLLEI